MIGGVVRTHTEMQVACFWGNTPHQSRARTNSKDLGALDKDIPRTFSYLCNYPYQPEIPAKLPASYGACNWNLNVVHTSFCAHLTMEKLQTRMKGGLLGKKPGPGALTHPTYRFAKLPTSPDFCVESRAKVFQGTTIMAGMKGNRSKPPEVAQQHRNQEVTSRSDLEVIYIQTVTINTNVLKKIDTLFHDFLLIFFIDFQCVSH